ncbi:MAG: peptidylprolyl isomerase [Pseudomonadota bacterium]
MNAGFLSRFFPIASLRREPFVHFLLLGALIFGVQALLERQGDARRQVVPGAGELVHLRAQYASLWGREPDAGAMEQLVKDWAREEVLYREAVARGLDRDDVIVRRRLVQKMDFLATADARNPSDAEVEAYYLGHQGAYDGGSDISFTQRFFRHAADAHAALALVKGGQAVAGEPFMLPGASVATSRSAIARDFGEAFAAAVAAAPAGAWTGPVKSAFGWHLVRIEARHATDLARFAAVRERVRADLVNQRLDAAREASYQRLLQHYRVADAGQLAP